MTVSKSLDVWVIHSLCMPVTKFAYKTIWLQGPCKSHFNASNMLLLVGLLLHIQQLEEAMKAWQHMKKQHNINPERQGSTFCNNCLELQKRTSYALQCV